MGMVLNVKPERLKEVVRSLAATSPDNKYIKRAPINDSTCSYLEGQCTNGSKGCIFGQAFALLGASETFLEECDKIGSITFVAKEKQLAIFNGYELTDDDIRWYRRVQSCQDSGKSWKEAVESADDFWLKAKGMKEWKKSDN